MEVNEQLVDKLHVYTFQTRGELGQYAASLAIARIVELQSDADRVVRIIFASAPSQSEFMDSLSSNANIDWSRIEAFHMDEYIGLATTHPQSFGRFLQDNLFARVAIGKVNFINGLAKDAEGECRRYADLLKAEKIDIVCMGIGENAHIAFNDPHVADFEDPFLVKIVDLDLTSRQQQVNDGCFKDLIDVPTHAITLTVPALFSGESLYCMVPGSTKAQAVYATLKEPIHAAIPSTILRKHSHAMLFVDQDSAAKLK